MGPEDVAALFEREGSGVPLDSYDETSEAPDVRQGRTAALSPILDSCRELWNLQSPDLALIAQKIGDGSRDGTSKRFPAMPRRSSQRNLEMRTPSLFLGTG
jgi:hypothetical protein